MTLLLTWLIAAYGMSQILVYGSIFNEQRQWIHTWGETEWMTFNGMGKFLSGLISCMMCTSTWVGFLMSFVWSPFVNIFGVHPALGVFFDGMLASGGVWAINAIVEWFEKK
jgi:NAD(P)H-hydrate repair Nnr-like enzyme with NAD(P)H-hydrate dehydratase domain